MNPELNKSVLIFLLSSIGLIVFPHIYHLPPIIFSFFFLLLGWRFAGIWKPLWLPNNLLILLLMACGIALFFSQHQGLFGRDAGTRLFVIAMGLKLMEIKTTRDLYLLSYLAFIVAASQFLYEQSLFMAIYIFAVCAALLATLVSMNIDKPRRPAVLKTTASIIGQALPITLVLFVLFPRLEAPRWLSVEEKQQTKSGLSDSMEPGSISDLGLSDELVFRVRFSGTMPPPNQRYWRGPVLSHTDGKRWTQSPSQDYQPILNTPQVSGSPYHYTLLLEPQGKNWVFGLDMPTQFSTALTRNASYQLISSGKLDQRAEYNITSYAHYNTGTLSRAELKDAKQLPAAPSVKIKQLVAQLQGNDSSPEQFIHQLLTHFKTEDFHYTLTPPLMEDNPIDTFLFSTRTGFCSHYAAAFVYLMRVADIPARVVTGFQGGELNAVGDFLEVRQANAHAWAEVWLAQRGWVRFDPTAAIAPERIEHNVNIDQLELGGLITYATDESAVYHWLKQTRQLWSNVDYNWQRWVINYDNRNQSRFLSSVGINDIKAMMYWMLAIIALITAVLGGFLLHQKQQAVDKSLLIYRRFCQKLAKHGLLRQTGEGETAFAERIKITLPDQAHAIDQITATFIKLRYGRVSTPQDLAQLQQWVIEFKVQ
jgi:transglutaminase-like putative cysteine protease